MAKPRSVPDQVESAASGFTEVPPFLSRPMSATEKAVARRYGSTQTLPAMLLGAIAGGLGLAGVQGGIAWDPPVYGGITLAAAILAIIFANVAFQMRGLGRAVANQEQVVEATGLARMDPPAARAKECTVHLADLRWTMPINLAKRIDGRTVRLAVVDGLPAMKSLAGHNALVLAVDGQASRPTLVKVEPGQGGAR